MALKVFTDIQRREVQREGPPVGLEPVNKAVRRLPGEHGETFTQLLTAAITAIQILAAIRQGLQLVMQLHQGIAD